MNIGNLGRGSALTSYTCNRKRKTRRFIIEQVHEATEDLQKDDSTGILILGVDCLDHLRNVWLGDMTKALYNLLGNTMRE